MKQLAQLNLPGNLGQIDFPATTVTDPFRLIGNVTAWALGIAGVIAVLALVYSGVMYITSGGNEEQAAIAKKNIVWVVIGLVLIASALIIVRVIINILNSGSPN